MPGTLSSGEVSACFVRLARCVPIAKRCDSSRSRCRKCMEGLSIGRVKLFWPRIWNCSLPAFLSGPLEIATTAISSSPNASITSCTALNWPLPPSISSKSGQLVSWRSGSSLRARSNRRYIIWRIIAKSSPVVAACGPSDFMLNFR